MIRVTFEDEELSYKATIEVFRDKLKSDPMKRIMFNAQISHEAGKLFAFLRKEVKEEQKK